MGFGAPAKSPFGIAALRKKFHPGHEGMVRIHVELRGLPISGEPSHDRRRPKKNRPTNNDLSERDSSGDGDRDRDRDLSQS